MRNNVRDLTKQKSSLSQQLEALKSKEEFNGFEQFLKVANFEINWFSYVISESHMPFFMLCSLFL